MHRYLVMLISLVIFVGITVPALQGYGNYQASDEFNGIIYEDLTCDELQAGSAFNRDSLEDLERIYIDCLMYATSPDNKGYGDLYCAFIMEQGRFIQGVVNDLEAVYEIKCGQD